MRKACLLALTAAAVAPLGACRDGSDPDGTAGWTGFEPAAVGFAFDGVILPDGTITGYAAPGESEANDALMILVFASEDFFFGGDPATETCVALGRFDPPPASPPIPTIDGSPLFVSYDTTLALDAHSCREAVDPRWGPDARELWGPFDGAHLGFGLGPMTDYLADAWSPETLATLGPAMAAGWVAINDLDGAWVASDWTTALLFEVDPETGVLATEEGPDGEPALVPVDVSGLVPGVDLLPPVYVRSYPIWYQDLPLVDFGNLADPPA